MPSHIEKAKADMVVLNRNLFEIDPNSIIDAKVVYTIFAGKIVYDVKCRTDTSRQLYGASVPDGARSLCASPRRLNSKLGCVTRLPRAHCSRDRAGTSWSPASTEAERRLEKKAEK